MHLISFVARKGVEPVEDLVARTAQVELLNVVQTQSRQVERCAAQTRTLIVSLNLIRCVGRAS